MNRRRMADFWRGHMRSTNNPCPLPVRFYIILGLLLGAALDDVGVSHALFFFFSGGVLVIDLY